ncbi:MAG: chromate efflux transporter [Candidatus Jettenia sp.]|nr:chromate efflux transporter [Candidatus Jettenia sp.]
MTKQNHYQYSSKPTRIHLFISFLKLGATAFGGPSMVAYIQKMVVEQKRWLSEETFKNGVALCQMIPGAISMQVAAYVGLKTRGILGACAIFIGFGLPAFFIMLMLSVLYMYLHTLPAVISIFNGLQAIVVGIVANAAVLFGKTSLKGYNICVAGISAALYGLNVNPIVVILLSAFLGPMLIKNEQFLPNVSVSSTRTPCFVKPFLLLLMITAIGFLSLFFLKRTLFDLAALMFKIDLCTFGGGLASIPLMFHKVVEVQAWMDGTTLLNGIVLGQVTPGSTMITATFIGYLLHGLPGGIVATISVFLPSFMLVIGCGSYFDRLHVLPYFHKIICGILCPFVGLLLNTTSRFACSMQWDFLRVFLASTAFVALLLKIDILWVVLTGILISVVILT